MQIRRTPMPVAKPLSFTDLEADIRAEVERRPQHPILVREEQPEDYAPPAVRALKETGLVWTPGQEEADPTEVGKLTAATVRQGYEIAAKEFEAMGEELTANLDRVEATKADTIAAIEELKEVAAHYREEGKRVALQIENHAALTTEARSTAKALKEKIASPPT